MEVSKMVVDRQKSATKVMAAGRTHQSKIGAGMAELLGSECGQAAERITAAATDVLERRTAAIVAADEAHLAELGDDPAVRAARDEASAALKDNGDGVPSIRKSCGTFRDPVKLLRPSIPSIPILLESGHRALQRRKEPSVIHNISKHFRISESHGSASDI